MGQIGLEEDDNNIKLAFNCERNRIECANQSRKFWEAESIKNAHQNDYTAVTRCWMNVRNVWDTFLGKFKEWEQKGVHSKTHFLLITSTQYTCIYISWVSAVVFF